MAHYSNLIFLLVQLLLVQSNDSKPSDFSQKRLTTRNQQEGLDASDHISEGERSSMLYSKTSIQQNYFKSQLKSTVATRNLIPNFDSYDFVAESKRREEFMQMVNRMSEISRQEQEANCAHFTGSWTVCGDTSQTWCCYRGKSCGTVSDRCTTPNTTQAIYIGLGLGFGVPIVLFGVLICHLFIEARRDSSATDRSARLLHMENFNSPPSEPENLIENIELKHSIVSIELQSSNNFDYNDGAAAIIVAEQISTLPPSYDDVIQQNSVIIRVDQLPLCPPTYEDTLRKNNQNRKD
ncbi:hypothetical protein I4U23_011555 [Adineta vaga]|nr:hypothetical protein I4U23_011555 [Adineta vaga]